MLARPATPLWASFLLGGLSVLSFAPFEWWWLSFFTLAGLFYFLGRSLDFKHAFLIGFSYGLGLYLIGASWVYVSLSTYGGMPLWMGAIAVLGFAALLSFFVGLVGYISARLFTPNSIERIVAITLIWPVCEWMKSWVLTGFPWLDIGYSQTPSWFFAWAPLGGLYLVSFMVAVVAACLALLKQSSGKTLIPILVLSSFSWWLNNLQWSQPIGVPLQIGVIQANVDVEEKWRSANRQTVIQQYSRLAKDLNKRHRLDLVVLPETAIPIYSQSADSSFWNDFKPKGTALLVGVLDRPSLVDDGGGRDEVYNAAVLACEGDTQVYRKRHLVPFGEYLPLRFLFNWVLDYLELPMSDMSAWQGQQSLNCGDKIKIGLSICYEDAFSSEYQQHVGDATLLVNISEDAWFGDSFAPHQRQQMAQMRARELARPMVRSANSGPSTFISHHGQIELETDQFKVQAISHEIQPQTGETPYKRWGIWPIYLCLMGVGLLWFVKKFKARKV